MVVHQQRRARGQAVRGVQAGRQTRRIGVRLGRDVNLPGADAGDKRAADQRGRDVKVLARRLGVDAGVPASVSRSSRRSSCRSGSSVWPSTLTGRPASIRRRPAGNALKTTRMTNSSPIVERILVATGEA
jgi:hypothetical protein